MTQKRRHRKNYNDPGHAYELTFSRYKGFIFCKQKLTNGWQKQL